MGFDEEPRDGHEECRREIDRLKVQLADQAREMDERWRAGPSATGEVRRMTLSTEDRPIKERLALAIQAIDSMTRGRHAPRQSIPVHRDDDDVLIEYALRDARDRIASLERWKDSASSLGSAVLQSDTGGGTRLIGHSRFTNGLRYHLSTALNDAEPKMPGAAQAARIEKADTEIADLRRRLGLETGLAERLLDGLRGLAWMFEHGALVRDTSADGEGAFFTRSMRWSQWLSSVFAPLHEGVEARKRADAARGSDGEG